MNERQEGATGSESQEDFTSGQEKDRPASEGMSTSDLLGRQEGKASTQTMEGQRPSQASMDGSKEAEGSEEPLIADAGSLNERWNSLQVRFVDEPKDAVREADGLVAE